MSLGQGDSEEIGEFIRWVIVLRQALVGSAP